MLSAQFDALGLLGENLTASGCLRTLDRHGPWVILRPLTESRRTIYAMRDNP